MLHNKKGKHLLQNETRSEAGIVFLSECMFFL